jgi:hypothetical protein
MIQANMAAAKVTIRIAISKPQPEENTAAITHKKQAVRVTTHPKKHALNEAYFNRIEVSYSIH